MPQLYYDSPESAIYMARFFKLRLVDQFGRPTRFEFVRASLEFAPMRQPDGTAVACHGAFVHVDSYRVLLQKKGDIVKAAPDGSVYVMEEDYVLDRPWNASGGWPDFLVSKARMKMQIIWRKSRPFIAPSTAIWKEKAHGLVLEKSRHE